MFSLFYLLKFRFVELSIPYRQSKEHPYMQELFLFTTYVRTGHVRTYTAIAPNASYRVTTKFAQSELDSAKQKAGYHRHGDTLPLLVYCSE